MQNKNLIQYFHVFLITHKVQKKIIVTIQNHQTILEIPFYFYFQFDSIIEVKLIFLHI